MRVNDKTIKSGLRRNAITKKPPRRQVFRGGRDFDSLRWNLNWCGDRRTVTGRERPVSVGLEFSRFFDVSHRVSINKSASNGFPWNRVRIFEL